ncbi:MAG: glycoside hydrolase family 97 protein [Erythrobacter sp.]
MPRKTISRAILCLMAVFALPFAAKAESASVRSPDERIVVTVSDENGMASYSVTFDGNPVIGASRLGIRFKELADLDQGLSITSTATASAETSWELPWGERRLVEDRHNELAVEFAGPEGLEMLVRFRVFDTGVGFRYEINGESGAQAQIIDELTEFRTVALDKAWWIPARRANRYEYLYRETGFDELQEVHTPFTYTQTSGIHVSIHEAALTDYAGMVLDARRDGLIEADLTPWYDGIKVRTALPFKTPWRTIQIAENAAGLINSDIILNLNEPNKLGDVSWVEPSKYVGIWWAMHIAKQTWWPGPNHGATTENTVELIDFAAENGIEGVLVEGWNKGWSPSSLFNSEDFSFTEPTDDFDIEYLAQYAASKGVRLVGYHETGANVARYEDQLESALDFYERLGVREIKTGYVSDGGEVIREDEDGRIRREWHDGQFMVGHYTHVLEEAAKRRIAIFTHEPVKDTGLRRTYPNWLAREGARGQEYNAWGNPTNPPEHTAILPFTRLLAGPMDYTPGIVNLTSEGHELRFGDFKIPGRVSHTLAKELSLYVVLYSPIQMAPDFPEFYREYSDAFRFIKDVPVDWEESIALDGAIGEFAVIARKERDGDDWYIGALSNESSRDLALTMDFLDEGARYEATIYEDGIGAHWQENPYPLNVRTLMVSSSDILELTLAPGGGAAIQLKQVD